MQVKAAPRKMPCKLLSAVLAGEKAKRSQGLKDVLTKKMHEAAKQVKERRAVAKDLGKLEAVSLSTLRVAVPWDILSGAERLEASTSSTSLRRGPLCG